MLPYRYQRIGNTFEVTPELGSNYEFPHEEINAMKEILRLARKELYYHVGNWIDDDDKWERVEQLYKAWLDDATADQWFMNHTDDGNTLPTEIDQLHSEFMQMYFQFFAFLSEIAFQFRNYPDQHVIVSFSFGHKLIMKKELFTKVTVFLADLCLELNAHLTHAEIDAMYAELNDAEFDNDGFLVYKTVGIRRFDESYLVME